MRADSLSSLVRNVPFSVVPKGPSATLFYKLTRGREAGKAGMDVQSPHPFPKPRAVAYGSCATSLQKREVLIAFVTPERTGRDYHGACCVPRACSLLRSGDRHAGPAVAANSALPDRWRRSQGFEPQILGARESERSG